MSSEQLILSWKDHNGILVSIFENLLKKNALVDCTIAAGGQYLKAHKIVLSACSSYFELLFNQESEKNPIVILKDVEFQELEAAINFMYRGEVEICEDRLAAFLEVAESLQIKGLGCDGKTQKLKEKSSPLSEKILSASSAVSPRQQPKKFALNSHSNSAGSKVSTGCELVGNNNSAIHQTFRSKTSCSSPTLPQSSSFTQSVQDPLSVEENFENDQSSLNIVPQFSSQEFEQSDVKPAIKIEPVDDTCEEEKCEDTYIDFRDELTKMEENESWDEHNVETMCDESSTSQQDDGAEYVVNSEGPYKEEATGSTTQIQITGITSRLINTFDIPAESLASSTQSQKCPRPEARKHTCLRKGKTSSNLALRKQNRLRNSNRVHKCPFCNYTTVKQSTLTRHLCTHTGEQLYECPYCIYKCARQDNLKTHIRIHTGEKPYQCPECDFKTSFSSSLKLHRRLHSGGKPY